MTTNDPPVVNDAAIIATSTSGMEIDRAPSLDSENRFEIVAQADPKQPKQERAARIQATIADKPLTRTSKWNAGNHQQEPLDKLPALNPEEIQRSENDCCDGKSNSRFRIQTACSEDERWVNRYEGSEMWFTVCHDKNKPNQHKHRQESSKRKQPRGIEFRICHQPRSNTWTSSGLFAEGSSGRTSPHSRFGVPSSLDSIAAR